MKSHSLAILLFLFLSANAMAQHPSVDPRWNLVFEDNFDDYSYIQSRWIPNAPEWQIISYDTATGNCTWANGLQAAAMINNWGENATKQVVVVDTVTGITSLRNRRVAIPYNHPYHCYHPDETDSTVTIHDTTGFIVNYEAGQLQSKPAYYYCYGYFEMRFMMPEIPTTGPNYDALGPNFWLWYVDGVSHHAYEIDIFENAYRGNTVIHTNCTHYFPDNSKPFNIGSPHFIKFNNQTGVWHTTAVNWTPDKVDFYFDGELTRTATGYEVELLQDVKMMMRVGISSPLQLGDPAIFPRIPLDSNTVPDDYNYYIDYVRVWQLTQDCETHRTVCFSLPTSADDITTYQGVVLGGESCDELVITDGVSIKASERIEIKDYMTLAPDTDPIILEVDGCMDYTP